jgi:hypothetical protein
MKTLRSSLFFIGMVLVLAACNAQSTSTPIATQGNPTPAPDQPTSAPTAQINPANTIQPASSGACANPYFPSTAGYSWTYANTSPMAPASTTTRSITDISATGFVVNDAITPDITMRVKWSCKDGNLTMLDSATISAASIQIAINSVTSTGFLIPATITAGNNWAEKLELVGTGDVSGTQKMTQQNDTQIACTANGKESVKVKAGTFDALKVTCIYTITTTTQIDANPGPPVTNTINITDWYVSGIGSVKTEKTGDIIETHELTGYSVP